MTVSRIRWTSPYFLPVLVVLALAVAFLPGIGNAGRTVAPDTQGNVGRFTALAMDGRGRPIVAYHDLSKRDLKLLRCRDASCEGNPSAAVTVLDSDGLVGTYTSLALDPAGRPVISYYDASNGKLKLLRCHDVDCAKSTISVPDASLGIVGQYASLVLDAEGKPVVSYYADSTGDLKLLRCSNPTCSGDQSTNISTPDTTGDVGLYTSLSLDTAGNPVISYHGSEQGLKLLHCDDVRCAGDESRNVFAVDTSGVVGAYSSMVLDGKGRPVISYYDASHGCLKLLRCDDPHCAGDEARNATTHKEGSAEEGMYASAVLDSEDRPVVSYYDSSNGDLKLLRCASPACR